MHPAQNLINKLSGREKAYFKKLNSNSIDAKFMKLYNYLVIHPTASIDDIKIEFKENSIGDRPHVELNYLQKHILRTLHVFHLKTNSLTRLLSYAEILITKKELTQASKIVQRLKEKAYQEEELEFILNAINLAGKIKDVAIVIRSKEDLSQEYEERSEILTEIQNITRLKKLKLELLNLHYNHIFHKIEITNEIDILQEELSLIKRVPFTFLGKDLWFSVNNLFYQSKREFDIAQSYCLKRLNHINQNKDKTEELYQLKAINNYLFITVLRKDYTEFNDKYPQLLAFERSKKRPIEKYIYFKNYLRLAIEINLNHQRNLLTLIPNSIKETQPIIDILPPSERNELLQLLISGCLLINDYKQAQKLLVLWSQYPVKGYLFLILKLNKIITFFGQRNDQLLKYEIDNLKKVIHNIDTKNDVYPILIKLFQKYLRKEEISELTIDFAIKEIQEIKKDNDIIFDYYELNYSHWLISYKSYMFEKR